MRVLLHENSADGHRLSYLAYFLPELLSLTPDVTIALPRCDADSPEFDVWLQPFKDRITIDAFDTGNVQFRPRTPIQRSHFLLQAIRRSRAQHVYIPSAYGVSHTHALYPPAIFSRGYETEVGVLRGGFAYPAPPLLSLKHRLALSLLRASRWNVLHFIDVIAYRHLLARGGNLARRARLLPDPVERTPETSKSAARRALGIPEDGRYVASTGTLTARKGIRLLLHAFQHAKLRPTDRLLLTGKCDAEIRALVDGPYAPLLRSGRVILFDRYLEQHELPLTLSAADLVATPYMGHVGVASIVIRAASVGRPIVANDSGWIGSIVSGLGLGTTCAPEPDAFTAHLPRALDLAETHAPSPASRRFAKFHDIPNFSACLAARLRERLERPPATHLRSWDWVLTGENAAPTESPSPH